MAWKEEEPHENKNLERNNVLQTQLMEINQHEFLLKAKSNGWHSPYIARKIKRQTTTPISHAINENKEINYSHWNRNERIPLTEAIICQIWTDPKRKRHDKKKPKPFKSNRKFQSDANVFSACVSSFERMCIRRSQVSMILPSANDHRSINKLRSTPDSYYKNCASGKNYIYLVKEVTHSCD